MKVPFVMHAKSLLKNIDTYYNDLEKSSTVKIDKEAACGFSVLTYCSFGDNGNNKFDYYS